MPNKPKKRSDGRYAKQVTVGTLNGKPIKKTVYGKTTKELDKNYRELMLLVDRNVILNNQSISVGELKDEWYRIKKDGKIRRNTECGYASVLKRIDVLKDMKVKDIKRYNVECLITDIQKEGFYNTSRTVLQMLKDMFNYAIENDIIVKNPCNGLNVKYDPVKKRALTSAEKEILDSENMPLKDRAFLYLLRYTGVRRGEIFALQKKDINKADMVIHISKTIIDNNGKPFVQDMAKTPAGDRYIPIFLRLAKPLFDYLDTVDDFLFLNKSGNIMASNSMQIMFKNMIDKYGLGSDLTMHCFRHNFVTECYLAGVDIKKTQSWVGHDDVSTTLNIYTHLSSKEISNGSDMDKYYDSQTEVKSKSLKQINYAKQAK